MKRSLKVAVLAACPFPSHQGTQVFVRHLAEAQARAGYDLELFSYGYGETSEELGFKHSPIKGVDAGLRSGPSLKRILNDGFLAWGLRKALIKNKFDILHVHNVEGLLIGLALKLTGIRTPLIYHVHNTMFQELPTYYSGDLTRAAMRVLGGLFDYLMPRHADAQIVFDNAHRELQIRRGSSHKRVFVARPGLHGAELRSVSKSAVDLPPGRYLVYCGNPDGYQNLNLLWEAFALAHQEEPDLKLLILTRAEPEDFGSKALEAFSRESAVFRKYANREEMVSYLSQAQVGVSSRILSTGFPVKLITYLQLGLKAVACRASLNTTSVENVWLSGESPQEFAKAILEAMKAAPAAEGAAAFEVDDSIASYLQAYEFALKQGNSDRVI